MWKGKEHTEKLNVGERIILNGTSRIRVEECGLDSTDCGWNRVAWSCKQGHEPSGSIKGG
jgi:hypothetical protein